MYINDIFDTLDFVFYECTNMFYFETAFEEIIVIFSSNAVFNRM